MTQEIAENPDRGDTALRSLEEGKYFTRGRLMSYVRHRQRQVTGVVNWEIRLLTHGSAKGETIFNKIFVRASHVLWGLAEHFWSVGYSFCIDPAFWEKQQHPKFARFVYYWRQEDVNQSRYFWQAEWPRPPCHSSWHFSQCLHQSTIQSTLTNEEAVLCSFTRERIANLSTYFLEPISYPLL